MARIIIIGGGVGGLGTAMLLAQDGHDVTLLERDPAPPPAVSDAWEEWERPGVNQFRLLHYFLPRFRQIVEAELPSLGDALDAAGAIRFNPLVNAPEEVRGPLRPGDSEYESITGRRPVMEAVIAATAEATPGVTVRRGVAVHGLIASAGTAPHVTGVQTAGGEEIRGDLVVDACGRRSALPAWLEALGARRPPEEIDDCGFIYFGRHFRSPDGSLPAVMAPLLMDYGTISCLTLPADHGTWGLGLIVSARDSALRGLRHLDAWERVARSLPLTAHWADGEPLDPEPVALAKIEDRHRTFCVDGEPVATGVLAVADAWACTNPSVGRGASMGLRHAVELRDLLRVAPADPTELAATWHQATMAVVEPMYRATLSYDRHRLAEIEAQLEGRDYDADPEWELTRALQASAFSDPDCFRAFLDAAGLLALPDEIFADADLLAKVIEFGKDWRQQESLGPSRPELLALVEG